MIAVISDSHIPRRADEVPEEFLELLEQSELNVHCGDLASEEVRDELESYGELVVVKGNCDFFDLPSSETFTRSGVEFGVYHGTGISPRGHLPTLVDVAEKLEVDVLLAGHTHQQRAEESDGKLVLNPGSCTGVAGGSYSGGNPEMMTVEVRDSEVEATLIELVDGEKVSRTEGFDV